VKHVYQSTIFENNFKLIFGFIKNIIKHYTFRELKSSFHFNTRIKKNHIPKMLRKIKLFFEPKTYKWMLYV
jgi:hypothetical protein